MASIKFSGMPAFNGENLAAHSVRVRATIS
jgi:hypothetical protein